VTQPSKVRNRRRDSSSSIEPTPSTASAEFETMVTARNSAEAAGRRGGNLCSNVCFPERYRRVHGEKSERSWSISNTGSNSKTEQSVAWFQIHNDAPSFDREFQSCAHSQSATPSEIDSNMVYPATNLKYSANGI
jgi:hypothetical protein